MGIKLIFKYLLEMCYLSKVVVLKAQHQFKLWTSETHEMDRT